MQVIREGATHKVVVGPFVDVGDGFTPETGVTLSGADDKAAILHDNATIVSISAYTWAAIASADGYYHLTLQTGITNTIGHLTIIVGDDDLCLPVKKDFIVMASEIYDALYASDADGFNSTGQVALLTATQASIDAIETDTNSLNDTKITGVVATKAEMDTAHGLLATEAKQDIIDTNVDQIETAVITNAAGTDIAADIIALKAETVLIVADTGELQTDWANGGRLDLLLDAIQTDLDNGTDGLGALKTLIDAIKAETVLIVADTGELQTDWVDGGRLDLLLDAIQTDLDNGTDGLGALKTLIDAIPTTAMRGTDGVDTATMRGTDSAALATALATAQTDLDTVTGTGGALIATGQTAAAWSALEESAGQIIETAVDDASASTTAFATDLTEATDDHYNGRLIVFTSGALAGQATDITDYTGSSKTVTVTALTEAPADNDTFYII